jgi:hypothetical protein
MVFDPVQTGGNLLTFRKNMIPCVDWWVHVLMIFDCVQTGGNLLTFRKIMIPCFDWWAHPKLLFIYSILYVVTSLKAAFYLVTTVGATYLTKFVICVLITVMTVNYVIE